MGRSAQRHQEGGRRPGDSRGAERPVGLILPAGRGSLACHHFENIRTRRIVSSHYNVRVAVMIDPSRILIAVAAKPVGGSLGQRFSCSIIFSPDV